MKIEVEYNEFSNWEFPVRVKHPECEHPDGYTEQLCRPDGSAVDKAYYCMICEAVGVVVEEDDERVMDWEHEQ